MVIQGGGGPHPGVTIKVTYPTVTVTFEDGTVRTFDYTTGADVSEPKLNPDPK